MIKLHFRVKLLTFASMERIINHIETLLRRHDYVIVPGLGGFVTQNQSAVILSETIEPPLSTVSFNPLLNISDGMLTIEISRAEKISFREATQLIDTEISKLKSILKSNKATQIGNLGILSVDVEDKIIFKPSLNPNLLPSNYGLSTLHYSQLVQSITDERRKLIITLPTSAKIAKYAAVGLIIFGAFVTVPHLNDARQNFAGINPEILLTASEKTIHNSSSNTTATPEITLHNETVSTPVEEPRFHVIVASLPNLKIAEKYCSELKANNFTQVHILPPAKIYRVAIESFTSKETAIVYMENLRKSSSEFSQAWVLCE